MYINKTVTGIKLQLFDKPNNKQNMQFIYLKKHKGKL